MKEMDYEFITMVNVNHKNKKESNTPKYTDHEIRMAKLRRKAEAERPKANREAIKFGLMMAVAMPSFWILFRLMIACMWAYSYAVRGF